MDQGSRKWFTKLLKPSASSENPRSDQGQPPGAAALPPPSDAKRKDRHNFWRGLLHSPQQGGRRAHLEETVPSAATRLGSEAKHTELWSKAYLILCESDMELVDTYEKILTNQVSLSTSTVAPGKADMIQRHAPNQFRDLGEAA